MDLQPIIDWAIANKPRFKPNGFGRQYGDLATLNAPAIVWDIKSKIIAANGLQDCQQEPIFKDYCGFITAGGAIHKHQDPNQNGKIHTRFNVMVSKPISGGVPVIDEKEVYVEEGDIWRCDAGLLEHWCTPVVGNKPRIVLSFGFLV